MSRFADDGSRYGPPDRPLAADEFYGPAREVSLADISFHRHLPTRDRAGHRTWLSLAIDVALRLEQTSDRLALEIPIKDDAHLESARKSLMRYFKRLGPRYARIFVRQNPPRLYVARGPNWYKPGGMDLPTEEKED